MKVLIVTVEASKGCTVGGQVLKRLRERIYSLRNYLETVSQFEGEVTIKFEWKDLDDVSSVKT